MTLAGFHPLITRWFASRLGAPTTPQVQGWVHIAEGRDTLIAAPTGSGKTLAAFLWSLNTLVTAAAEGSLPDETLTVYVSPLRALANDIQKNLLEPLAEIKRSAADEGMDLRDIRVAVRTGDTPARERTQMLRRPPHILITTPESLYILLTAEGSRRFLQTAKTVIVDEIHAVAGDKRGSHLALTLERLDLLAGRRLLRIGLSATQKPIEEIAQLLIGAGRRTPEGRPDCAVVDVGHRRAWELGIEIPAQPLTHLATHELWGEIYDRVVRHVRAHRTTLIFVNTRRLAERVAHNLTMRLGEGKVATHHSSLSRKTRLEAERRLKSGDLPVIVATASLELGIDIGHVDLVIHLGAPRSLANLLQRIGRSGHWLGATPKGIIVPLTRDELVQSAAAIRAVRAGELDRIIIPGKPLDVLAQQIVATVAGQEMNESDLLALIRRAYPYRRLEETEYEQVLTMLSDGIAARRGRAGAFLHRDRVHGVLRARRGARLAAITSGGAIPDIADYDVIEDPSGAFVGKVNEDFAVESMAGDIFLLGNTSWRIRRIESGRVRVENAHGQPPTIPFWTGEAPARTRELADAVSDLRAQVATRLHDPATARRWLMDETGVEKAGADQIVAYFRETAAVLGTIPTQQTIVAERFFDEAGGMQLVLHTPFGGRINRAWGLALRKRFCLTFDFELQAAATDDGIILSLGEQHSFPLDSVFAFVRPRTAREDLIQALLASPMFTNRWRWNANRALAVLRFQGGRRVPMPIQRMRADDLMAAVFPDQVACQDNRSGPITPPDHPLVNETILNCLHEAMDLDGLVEIVERMEQGRVRTVAVDTPVPSAMSHEIVNANPFAFLDDAPLEERRARAVTLRRTDPDLAKGVGALDQAAIDEVRLQAWPDVRNADELHDALLTLGLLPEGDAESWIAFAGELVAGGRATLATWRDEHGNEHRAYVAAERYHQARAGIPDARFEPEITHPLLRSGSTEPSPDDVIRGIVHGWMQVSGPASASALAGRLGLNESDVAIALAALESTGAVLRGRFTPGSDSEEWCERRLLSRIHRLTLGRLRREIEAVALAEFMRFLFRWQHVQPGAQVHGRDGVAEIIGQLQGLELPAPSWEESILPSRVRLYDPADLEYLTLSGAVTWGRLTSTDLEEEDGRRPVRRRQVPGRSSPLAFALREDLPTFLDLSRDFEESLRGLSPAAGDVARFLADRGASFLTDIVQATRRMPGEVEEALWELVVHGVVSGDGVAGLRQLLHGGARRRRRQHRLRRLTGTRAHGRSLPVGRWALWRPAAEVRREERDQMIARQLLRRYGVVFRDLLHRERAAPLWRVLVQIYRQWEAQGRIRGGRFVAGLSGEQFALPEAVEALRAVRRAPEDPGIVVISSADPLNLVGVILPGSRVPVSSGQAIAFKNGIPTDVAPLGALLSRLRNERAATLR